MWGKQIFEKNYQWKIFDSKINMFITNIDLFIRTSSSAKESLAKNEYRLPAPDMSKQYEGHYENYLLSLSESSLGFDHSFQPSVKIASLGKCKNCPSFYFESKTGKVRHVAMFHRRQKRAHPKKDSCDTCGQMF